MTRWYLLDGHKVVPSRDDNDVIREKAIGTRVAQTSIGDSHISTVFLSLDHRHLGDGPPLVFETLVIGGAMDGEMDRYSTWDEAVSGHDSMVNRVREVEK